MATKPEGNGISDALPDWLTVVARTGYFAKGVIYLTLGLLSAGGAVDAFGSSLPGEAVGTTETIRTLGQHSLGGPVLALLAGGLACYVAWRFAQAFLDPERRGSEMKAVLSRTILFLSGATYLLVLLATVDMLLQAGATGSGGAQRELWAGRLLAAPLGRWLLVLIGIGVFARGISEAQKAYTARFADKFQADVSEKVQKIGIRLGRIGLAARSVIFAMIGASVAYAGYSFDPSEVQGTEDALLVLERLPTGDWIAAGTALGLATYGAYQLFKGAYRYVPSARNIG